MIRISAEANEPPEWELRPSPHIMNLAEAVLVAHQRMDSQYCLCGWGELGKSHAKHVAHALHSAGALRTRNQDA